jgi:aminodeoxychorismate synthase component I
MTLPSPSATPLELYARVASPTTPSFFFQSGKGPATTARYSFFGTDPYQVLKGKNGFWILQGRDGMTQRGSDPFLQLTELCRRSALDRTPETPPLSGGAVGYLAYDCVRQFETLPSIAPDDLAVPDLEFGFYDLVAAIDHRLGRLALIYCPPLQRFLGEPREKLFREGCDRLAALEARLSDRAAVAIVGTVPTVTFAPEQHRSDYMDRVLRCQEYIAAGDIYQANLSHRFVAHCPSFGGPDAFEADLRTYHRLHGTNPSPFSGLLRFDDIRVISSSPERLVRLTDRRADTRPIAGTRPRGRTSADDRRLVEELCANEKERAEHVMLVDLERNDLGRVCGAGSVRVDELMALEQYSHVTHLVSNVTGTLRPGMTGFDLLKAVFPGGTITGVPKIRCMEIIEELEPTRRGPYTGSMGYIGWSGDMDFNILIRTLVIADGRGSLQVGAGIVADSDPGCEYQETLYKAQSFFSAFS